MKDEQYRKYFLELAKKENMRPDGRGFEDFREPIKVEQNISKNAEGSAKVTIGKTTVVVGVKAEVGTPYPDKPNEGSMMVTAEFAALASPHFEPGAPGEDAIELARIVDRGIREGGAIDTKKLCITEGEKVWLVIIDIYIQNHDGNLIDAAALAALAALKTAKFPKYDAEKEKVDYNEHTETPIPIVKNPIAVTVVKIGERLIVDPTIVEENIMDARITITSSEGGEINGMQKGGDYGLSAEETKTAIDIALKKGDEIRTKMGW